MTSLIPLFFAFEITESISCPSKNKAGMVTSTSPPLLLSFLDPDYTQPSEHLLIKVMVTSIFLPLNLLLLHKYTECEGISL